MPHTAEANSIFQLSKINSWVWIYHMGSTCQQVQIGFGEDPKSCHQVDVWRWSAAASQHNGTGGQIEEADIRGPSTWPTPHTNVFIKWYMDWCVSPVFMKIIGHIGHFRWLGPNVWWEISQIWIEYIKPIGQMSDESWKFFGYTVSPQTILASRMLMGVLDAPIGTNLERKGRRQMTIRSLSGISSPLIWWRQAHLTSYSAVDKRLPSRQMRPITRSSDPTWPPKSLDVRPKSC